MTLDAARKRHRDNVLIGEPRRRGQRWHGRALLVPDHVVVRGRDTYSPTHLVEMTRQLVTGVAHRLTKASAEKRFILTGIRLDLSHPIALDTALVLALDATDAPEAAGDRTGATIVDTTTELLVDDLPVGTVVLSGQRVDERDYRRLRGLEDAALD